MFAGYDCGRPASTVCFYCVVTEEYEREKRSGWHPDIAEAIAQAQAYEGTAAEIYAPRPLAAKAESEIADLRIRCERAEAEIEGLTGDTHALDAELAARAEKAEAELATVKAELEAKRPEAKAPTRDALQRAILETLGGAGIGMAGRRGSIRSAVGGDGRQRRRCHRAARAGRRRRSASFLQGQNGAHRGRADNRVARVRPLGVRAVVGKVRADVRGLSDRPPRQPSKGLARADPDEPAGGRKPPAVPLGPSSRR